MCYIVLYCFKNGLSLKRSFFSLLFVLFCVYCLIFYFFLNAGIRNRIQVIVYRYSDNGVDDDDDDDDDVLIIMFVMQNTFSWLIIVIERYDFFLF